MGAESHTDEVFLLPLDPQRGLRRITDHLTRYADLDPKLREAARLLDRRFQAFSEQEQEMLGALLWAYLRGRIKASASVGAILGWIEQGDAILPRVEAALETTFSVESLKALLREGTQLAATESAGDAGAEIQRARDEVRHLTAPEILLPIAVLTGIGLATVITLAKGGSLVAPPPPPPPEPTGPPGDNR